MHELIQKAARQIIIGLLEQCSEKQRLFFKKIYNKQEKKLTEVLEELMLVSFDSAIGICERTIQKKFKK